MREFSLLRGVRGLVQGVVTRHSPEWGDGASAGPYATWNLGLGTEDDRSAVLRNRELVARHLGFSRLVMPHQVHGTDILRLGSSDDHPGKCDGLLVNTTGILAGVMGADCPGFLLVHPPSRTFLVAHAGWRGTAGGMATAAVARLQAETRASPHSFLAAIGPGIGMDNYEVSPDVVAALQSSVQPSLFARGLARASAHQGHAYVDLCGILHVQLVNAGLPNGAVDLERSCTWDRADLWFSHRRENGITGRHALVAGWRA